MSEPVYRLGALKDVEPVEYAVFTHSYALSCLWHAAISRNVSPWGVLGTALAYTAAAVEPTVQIPPIIGGRASLNLLVGIVGQSGLGKGASQSVVEDFLYFTRDGFGVEIEEFPLGTGQGIAEQFRPPAPTKGKSDPNEPPPVQRTRALFVATEIDTVAAGAQQRGSTLMSTLRKVWSGENPGNTNGNSDTTRHVPKHSYRASLVCSIQPERSHSLLNSSEAAGGTPQRWLWMDCAPYPLSRRAADEDKAQAVVVELPCEFSGQEVCTMQIPQHVWDHTRAMHIANVEGRSNNALNTHANLTRLKVACLLAIMDGRAAVGDDDWEVSGLVMKRSDCARGRCQEALKAVEAQQIEERASKDGDLQEARARDQVEKAKATILRALEKRGELRWSGDGGLHQRCRRQRNEAEDALRELLDDGHVQMRREEFEDDTFNEWFFIPRGEGVS